MSKTIWKFELSLRRNEIDMPVGAEILNVGSQNVTGEIWRDTIVLWAEVEPEAVTERRVFSIYGTGYPHPPEGAGTYLGTALLNRTTLVYHVYEEEKT